MAQRYATPIYATPRYAALCAVAALAVGLAGCAATPEPARTAERTAAANRAPGETNTGDALARIARRSLEAGDPESAVSMLKRAHEMSPRSAAILTDLGRTLAALKAWKESADAYAKAADIDPKDPSIRRGHASALLALDLPTLAEQQYRAALALHEDASTQSGLGVTLDLQGRHDEAVAAFRRALELDPNGAATRTNLGLSLALWGSSNEAIGLLALMAASSTADARQRQNLALAFGLAGDLDQARAISKIDLGEEAVRNNLAYYETLRGLTPVLRMRALMGSHTPAVAGDGSPKVAASTGVPTATPVDATPPSTEPVKPSRAAERAPDKKTETTAPVAAVPSKPEPTDVAETAPAKKPSRAKTAAVKQPTPVEPKIQPEADTASVQREVIPPVESAAAPTAEPAETSSASAETVQSIQVEPKPAANAPAATEAAATEAQESSAAETPSDEHASALAESKEPGAPSVAVEPAAAAADSPTDVFEGTNHGAATASALASTPQEAGMPTEDLPEVSVRMDGVPVADVPQANVIPPVATENDAEKGAADVKTVPVAGASTDVPPPSTGPIKRDAPTRLGPQSHAAIESLY